MLTGPEVLDIGREGIWLLLQLAGPLMLVGLVVGLAIALVQALTQVQEMTLVFVPKIISIFLAMIVALPFMASVLAAYMSRISGLIIGG
ncbi:Flagellar biosynthesis protein FliQ [Candidatus Phaeomarinobacter ectocarpi]|uniref:Flagellar biosynthetic protein FliQ n=1 Tax=Candidatus Phaeomarinibacter ectocarpi TaxID=1458461 RepID=X5M691_9HYPH|nr:Flagellar biosynthesis protein FliQ [Candidatus Phaeomarinobacter ectocarpi]